MLLLPQFPDLGGCFLAVIAKKEGYRGAVAMALMLCVAQCRMDKTKGVASNSLGRSHELGQCSHIAEMFFFVRVRDLSINTDT